jgi:hypothetical protein
LTEIRQFHIGDILSVTTGRLVAPNHMQAIYELLDFMTGDSNFTHQLPRVSQECAPELLRQHPDLANVEVPDEFGEPIGESVDAWLAEQVATYGVWRDVAPLPRGVHVARDPLAELAEMVPADPIIVVHGSEGGR